MAATTDPHQLHLVLRSEHAELERVVDEAERFITSHVGDDDDFVYRAVLLTTEAVTNAIEHGNGLEASKKVTVEMRCEPERCVIAVEDEGTGFQRDAVADPRDRERLLADGGRGLFLIETMANEVRYERGGRRVVVVLDRAAPPPLP